MDEIGEYVVIFWDHFGMYRSSFTGRRGVLVIWETSGIVGTAKQRIDSMKVSYLKSKI